MAEIRFLPVCSNCGTVLKYREIDFWEDEFGGIDALETIGYDFSDSGLSEIESAEVCEAVGDVRQDMIRMIKRLPPAQPEIIRCKDCKHRDKYGCCKYWKGLAMGDIPIATDDYDFCSYAKRI